MSIEARWYDNEKTIIHFVYDGKWTWEEFYAMVEEEHRMIETVNHVVDVIIDMTKSTIVPSNVFNHAKHAVGISHARRGQMIVVHAPRLIKTLYDAFMKVYGKATKELPAVFVENIEDAVAHAKRAAEARRPVVSNDK